MKILSFLNQINLFIRSCLFSISMMSFTIVYSFLCLLAKPLSFSFRYNMIMFWTSTIVALLKKLCRVDYIVEGLDNIPQDRVGVVLSKHQSSWETFYLPTIFHQSAIILKRELLWVPFFGWGLANVDPIAINRKAPSSAMEQIIKQGRACIKEGRWILVFPEGTRTLPGQIGRYHLGGARLAVAAEAPVIPVAHNAGVYWPKRRFLKKPGTIRVIIGPIIETKDRTPEDVMTEAKNWNENKMKDLK